MAIHVTDRYGWCADAHHHLRPRRCVDSNPQRDTRCAGAHHHCRPRRCVDSNHRRVIQCVGAHHHPRPCGRMDSNYRLVNPPSSTPGVDSNHRRVIRCAGAHYHPRSCRCMDSNHRLVIQCAGAHQRFRPCRCMGSDQRLRSSAVHTEDAYIDLLGAKYRSDKYVRELHTYTPTFRAGAQVGGRQISLIATCMGVTTY